jgi:SAM-dependent methyltransferase
VNDFGLDWTAEANAVRENALLYKRDFWRTENLKFSEPWYRLEKSARLIAKLSKGRRCTLLDVGCGPGTLMQLLPPNVQYFGIDIAIQEPGPQFLERDLVERSIAFGDRNFDIIVAQGLFEYLGATQRAKFSEVAKILTPQGHFLVSYTNFAHRKAELYPVFSNVQTLNAFKASLSEFFTIDRVIPASHNWAHSQPVRHLNRAVNLHVNINIPVVSRLLAVDYFFVCSRRH